MGEVKLYAARVMDLHQWVDETCYDSSCVPVYRASDHDLLVAQLTADKDGYRKQCVRLADERDTALAQVEQLKNAICKADQGLGNGEGVGLLHYMDELSTEGMLIDEVLRSAIAKEGT